MELEYVLCLINYSGLWRGSSQPGHKSPRNNKRSTRRAAGNYPDLQLVEELMKPLRIMGSFPLSCQRERSSEIWPSRSLSTPSIHLVFELIFISYLSLHCAKTQLLPLFQQKLFSTICTILHYNILVTYHFTMQKRNCYLGFSRSFSVQYVPFFTTIY